MSNVTFWYGNWQFWEDYPNQKVAFDGSNRIIYVNEGVTELDVQVDIYSAWKEWVLYSQQYPLASSYVAAFSIVGGDPITDTQNVGITYFLENGWRIQPFPSKTPYTLTVDGNLYTREVGGTPFLFAEGVSTSLVRSNIVDLIQVEALGVNITDTDLQAIASKVWNEALADYTTNGTTGHKLGKIATKVQDIALR